MGFLAKFLIDVLWATLVASAALLAQSGGCVPNNRQFVGTSVAATERI